MNTVVQDLPIIPMAPAADQSGKEGYFVELSSGKASVANAATDSTLGVIVDGAATSGKSSIALHSFPGLVRVKLSGTVSQGAWLCLGTDGSVVTDPGTGSRMRVAQALEDGVSGDLIKAILITPLSLS